MKADLQRELANANVLEVDRFTIQTILHAAVRWSNLSAVGVILEHAEQQMCLKELLTAKSKEDTTINAASRRSLRTSVQTSCAPESIFWASLCSL